MTTSFSFGELRNRLKSAIEANGLLVVTAASANAGAKRRGSQYRQSRSWCLPERFRRPHAKGERGFEDRSTIALLCDKANPIWKLLD